MATVTWASSKRRVELHGLGDHVGHHARRAQQATQLFQHRRLELGRGQTAKARGPRVLLAVAGRQVVAVEPPTLLPREPGRQHPPVRAEDDPLEQERHPALAVLEPLLAHLVATDVEVLHGLGHTAEADGARRGWPFFVAAASSQMVSCDQRTRPTSGLAGPVYAVIDRSSLGDSIRCRATSSPPSRSSSRNSFSLPGNGRRGKSFFRYSA